MDQAKKLREMMSSIKKEEKNKEKLVDNKLAKVISISSGKGGVGKTNFTINLALSLRRKGFKVAILDADIGLGNIEILIGSNIKYTISDLVNKKLKIEDIIFKGPEGINIISGGSGLKELTLLSRENFPIILNNLNKLQLEFDYILIDTGAGISDSVLDFIIASDEVIVISTSDPTSVMDAYVLIKSLSLKEYLGKINLVTNMVDNKEEAKITKYKIINAAKEFLSININYLGYIYRDNIVNKAVAQQIPFLIASKNSRVARQIYKITDNITLDATNLTPAKESFADKLLNFFFK